MRSWIILTVGALALAACSPLKQHPDFANSWNRQYSVAVVPTKVVMKEIGVASVEDLDVDSSGTDKLIKAAVEKGLAKHDYVVKVLDFDMLAKTNPDIKFQVKQLQDKTEAAAGIMFNKSENGLAETSIGPLANHFGSISGADLIAVPYFTYIQHSDGSKAIRILIDFGASAQSQGHIALVLVDAKTGNVMWQNRDYATMSIFGQGLEERATEVVIAENAVEDLLKTLPNKSKAKPAEVEPETVPARGKL